MNEKQLHKEATRLAEKFSDETEFTYEYNKKHKLWIELDTTDMSMALMTDLEIFSQLGKLEKDLF
jgi:hypothetical protein